jgi:ABC-type multidrug transport system fused ATPase/permease subunit
MSLYTMISAIKPLIVSRPRHRIAGFACMLGDLGFNLAQPLIFARFIDRVLIQGHRNEMWPLLLLSLVLAAASAACSVGRWSLFSYLDIRNTLDIREALTRHIRQIPIRHIEKDGSGRYLALLGFDSASLSFFLNKTLVDMISHVLMMSMALGILCVMDWRLALMAGGSTILILTVPRVFRSVIRKYAEQVRSHNETIGGHLVECIDGSKEIRLFGLEDWEAERNRKMYKGLVKSSTRETLFRSSMNSASALIISVIIVLTYYLGGRQVMDESITIGVLIASISYLNNVLNPIRAIADAYGEIRKAEVAADRIGEFLQTPVEKSYTERLPAHTAQAAQTAAASEEKDDVQAWDLHVSGEGKDILEEISFRIPKGETAAFVGRSGSGKTTLFKAVLGLVDRQGGEILVTGSSLDSISRSEINSRFGVVFQDTFLFKGTLFENIAIGNLNATEEEVYEAACNANLKEYLDQLPQGIHTPVDYKGAQLSGGQRQRIAIARVLLKKPDILVLDEPTSSLDNITEEEVLRELRSMMKGKTTLVATHLLETIRHAEQIFVLEDGRIVGRGTHEELSRDCALYQSLLTAHDDAEEAVPV